MDIHSFFGASSSTCKSTDIASSSEDESESTDTEYSEPRVKKQCTGSTVPERRRSKSRPLISKRKYNKKWEETFPWVEYDENFQGAFCKVCRKRGMSLQRTGGAWITKPFNNWKKATEKMRAHSQSEVHIQSYEAELAASTAMQEGSIAQHLQHIGEQERMKNRVAIKALIRCTHFLALMNWLI